MKNEQDALVNIIDSAIDLNLERQERLSDVRQTLGEVDWLLKFGVVRINLGRQLGHTEYIIRNALPTDVIVHRNATMRDLFTKRRHHYGLPPVHSQCSYRGFAESYSFKVYGSKDPMTIWIDGEFVIDDLRLAIDVILSNGNTIKQIVSLG